MIIVFYQKTYYPAAGAMRVNSTLYLIRADYLGSATAVTDSSGNVVGRQLYYPYGQTRLVTGTLYTDRLFTGQREMAGLGIYHYNARFYSLVNNHFISADTIVPNLYNPQSLNRYSYVRNNPIRFNDPSGHIEACDDYGTCKVQREYSKLNAVDSWKKIIKDRFGVTMSDGGGKAWDIRNLMLANSRLNDLNNLLKGKLKSVIGSATFDLKEYTGENCPKGKTCSYGGFTSGTHITFSTTDGNAIVEINFYHEFGHMLNSLPGHDDVFSNRLDGLDTPSFISNNYVNKDALASLILEPIQASSNTVREQWGDVFGNYAAGNIDLSDPYGPGADMYDFITGALNEFLYGSTKNRMR